MRKLQLGNRLKKLKSSRVGKIALILLISTSILAVLLIVNYLLFSARTDGVKNAANDITSVIDSSNTQFLSEEERAEIEIYYKELSVGYPQVLARLSYPFSSEKRNNIGQLYKLTDTSKQYVKTLYELPEIYSIVNSVPTKETLTDNPDLFISNYNNAISDLEQYNEALDIDTVLKIFVSIRDSAEYYVVSGNFDVF
jgi:hypothetical protein